MRILYASDLHGHEAKYGKILKHAVRQKIDAVILGGGLLPGRDPLIQRQATFCRWLRDWMYTITQNSIHVIYILGNDDLSVMDNVLFDLTHDNPMIHWVDGVIATIGDYTFAGMSQVKDLPYGLKDRARLDYQTDDPLDILQPHTAYLTRNGKHGCEWVEMPIEEWIGRIKTMSSLFYILWRLPVDRWDNTILITHDPPFGIGLDMTVGGEQVGSKAVLDFIEDVQPHLTLHGHIHESPSRTGIWKVEVNNTTCIQVGQPWGQLSAVIVDLETRKTERIVDNLRKEKEWTYSPAQ